MDEYSPVEVNYWVDKTASIQGFMKETKDVALVLHNSIEFADMTDFFNVLPTDKIVYLSMTKTYDSIKPYASKLKAKIYVVDCVSSSLFAKEDTPDCMYVKPVQSLGETVDVLKNVLPGRNGDYVIIDAVSQFINFSKVFQEDVSMVEYLNELKSVLRRSLSKAVLLYDDNTKGRIKYVPRAFISQIIKMEVYKDKIDWR
jgi:hypothetical protein